MTEIFILLTIVFWGVAPMFDKSALKAGGDPFLGTIIRGVFIGASLIIAAVLSGKLKPLFATSGRAATFFMLSGLFAGVLGSYTYFKALQNGPTSKIVPLVAVYPVVTALLSVILLGETITLPRIAGILLIIGGIYLVK